MFEWNDNENTTYRNLWDEENSAQRKKSEATSLST